MAKLIVCFLFVIITAILNNCDDKLFKDPDTENLSAEDSIWLNDSDGDDVADSLDKYAKECSDPVIKCLQTAKENKEKEEERIQDSLKRAAVEFSPQEGSFHEAFQVEITTESNGIIRYTNNGSEPSEKSEKYDGPISITVSTELKARTFSKSNDAGPVKSAKYELKVKKPTAAPKGGAYSDTIKIMLTCDTDKAAIFYTINGQKPSFSSAQFKDSLEIKNATTIKAQAMREGWTASDTLEVRYRIDLPGVTASPVFKPEAGTYHEVQEVSITSEEGAEIRYTLDGKAPDSSSMRYSEKIIVDSGLTIRAIASKEGKATSAPDSAKYILKPSKPEFNPSAGTYEEEQSVAITVKSPTDAKIHFTTDGQTPSDSSKKYMGLIPVSQSMTIKARAFYKNWEPSEILEKKYIIKIPEEVSAPVFDPAGGTFSDSVLVNISTDEANAKIYYTTDGSAPSESDNLFESGFSIYSSTTLMAVAVNQDGKSSKISQAVFEIKTSPPDTSGPVISLLKPSWKDTAVASAEITIDITAQDASGVKSVTINGAAASLSEGKYNQTLTLGSGENKIVVMAEDESANQNKSVDTLKISYDPPPDAVTLFPPTHISGDGMRITWSRNDNTDFQFYKVYYSESSSVSLFSDSAHKALKREDTAYTFSGLTSNRTYSVKVYVFDNTSGTGSNVVSAFLNTAPVFDETAGQSVDENTELSFTISATDADGDDLVYSMIKPSITHAEFDSASKTFSWTPTYMDAGNYVAKFEVTDNLKHPGLDTLVVNITVNNVNVDSLIVRNLLDVNGFSSVPVDSTCKYAGERISELYLDSGRIGGQLTSLPADIGNLSELKKLEIYSNKLTSLPKEIGQLIKLNHLDVSFNKLSDLPDEIGNLINLSYLNVKFNQISRLPASFGNLTNLSRVWLNFNHLSRLPSSFCNLSELMWFYANGNKLISLPMEIGSLTKLVEIYLAGNRLINLPPQIVNLPNLTKLYVNKNKLCNLSKPLKTWINTYSIKPDWESTQSCAPP